MATPFINVPKFRITFNIVAQTLTFTDLIQGAYSAYGTVTDFEGLIQVTDPNGTVVYQTGGFSLTIPTFATPDIKGAVTAVWIKTGIPASVTSGGLITPGSWTFDYIVSFNNGSTFFHIQKIHVFDYISPVVSIDLVADCRTSTLISSDVTELTVNSGGVDYEPVTNTRTHTIQKPLGSSANDPGYTAEAVRVIGGGVTDATRLWSRVWQTEIELELQYNIALWDAYVWVMVLDTVTGTDAIDVRCNTDYCNLRVCVENAVALWNSALNTGFGHAAELQTKIVQISAEWMKYEMAERCGYDTNIYITNLKSYLSKIDCTSSFNSDESSQVVYALGTAIGGGSVGNLPTISYGATFPTGGIAGSLYIYRDSPTTPTFTYVMFNSGGTWIQIADILGADGAAGAAGNNNSSANILYPGITDLGTDAGTSEKTLDTYTVPGSTLVNVGDYLELVAVFDLALNARGKKVRLYFGGDLLCSFFTDELVGANTKSVVLRARIHKVTVTSQKFDAYVEAQGGFISSPVTGTATKNLAATVVVHASGQNSSSYASDIVIKTFTVLLYSKLTTIPTSISNWDAGEVDLVADTLTAIPFSVIMPDATYRVFTNATDVDGYEQLVQVPPDLKTTTGLSVQVGVNCKLYWRVEA